ncbi:hypothetical protein GMB70_09415 [Turicibacter sanguinis]|nr:hypothetical protein [Turicibacter sanguinis]
MLEKGGNEMALGYLFLLFVILFILAFLIVVLLISVKKSKLTHAMIWISAVYSFWLAWINVTSLPTNFYLEQGIGILIGTSALVGLILYYRHRTEWVKGFVIFSIVANIVQLFFF